MTQTQLNNETRYSDSELDRRREFDRSRPLERDETDRLISSDKVEGTKVYSIDGDDLGHIDSLMIGKRSGRVEYAVMNFGSFLGMGGSYHPLPWDALDYDPARSGYVVNIDKNRLKDAPSFSQGDRPGFDRQYGETVFGYYGVTY